MSSEEIRQKLIEDCNEESCKLITANNIEFKDDESEITAIELVSSLLIDAAEKQQQIDRQAKEIETLRQALAHETSQHVFLKERADGFYKLLKLYNDCADNTEDENHFAQKLQDNNWHQLKNEALTAYKAAEGSGDE